LNLKATKCRSWVVEAAVVGSSWRNDVVRASFVAWALALGGARTNAKETLKARGLSQK
jgi:hypothetical protein